MSQVYLEFIMHPDKILAKDGMVNVRFLARIKESLKRGYLIPERNRLKWVADSLLIMPTRSQQRRGLLLYLREEPQVYDVGILNPVSAAKNWYSFHMEFDVLMRDAPMDTMETAIRESWGTDKLFEMNIISKRMATIHINPGDSKAVAVDRRQNVVISLGASKNDQEVDIFNSMAGFMDSEYPESSDCIGYRVAHGEDLDNTDFTIFSGVHDSRLIDDGLSSGLDVLKNAWMKKVSYLGSTALHDSEDLTVSI